MIGIATTNNPSDHVQKRAKHMKVKTLTPFTYRVTQSEPDKPTRVVHLDKADGDTFKIECYDPDTGESCPANQYGLHCSHCEAALRRLLANAKRQETREQKTEEDRPRKQRIYQYAREVLSKTKQPDLKGVLL
jgi:hypothetical protein